MLDDGTVLTEGPAIVQFLADGAPDGERLLPAAGSLARNQVQSWLNFITAELHKPMAMLLNPAYAGAHDGIRALVSKRLAWLDGRIAGPYLTGDAFTVADAYLFVCLNWSPWIAIDLRQWPAVHNLVARVGARPKVQDALQAEELAAFEANGTFFAPRSYLAGRAGAGARP